MSNPLPRNGRYEIFTNNDRTYCFDDLSFPTHGIAIPLDMIEWIRSQDTEYWEPLKQYPEGNAVFYLRPELYTVFKLKYL